MLWIKFTWGFLSLITIESSIFSIHLPLQAYNIKLFYFAYTISILLLQSVIAPTYCCLSWCTIYFKIYNREKETAGNACSWLKCSNNILHYYSLIWEFILGNETSLGHMYLVINNLSLCSLLWQMLSKIFASIWIIISTYCYHTIWT